MLANGETVIFEPLPLACQVLEDGLFWPCAASVRRAVNADVCRLGLVFLLHDLFLMAFGGLSGRRRYAIAIARFVEEEEAISGTRVDSFLPSSEPLSRMSRGLGHLPTLPLTYSVNIYSLCCQHFAWLSLPQHRSKLAYSIAPGVGRRRRMWSPAKVKP